MHLHLLVKANALLKGPVLVKMCVLVLRKTRCPAFGAVDLMLPVPLQSPTNTQNKAV